MASQSFSFLKHFCLAIWVCLADFSVRELSDTDTIWVQNIFLTIGKFDRLDP